jgi:hypothetical protein
MNEEQFIEFQSEFWGKKKSKKLADPNKTPFPTRNSREKNAKNIAFETLFKNITMWFHHLDKQENHNFELLIKDIDVGQPELMKSIVICYLFYVKMINNILPGPGGNDKLGVQLVKLF